MALLGEHIGVGENRPVQGIACLPERRAEDRNYLSVYRSAMVRWRGLEGLCLVRNISPHGLMGKMPAELETGEPVTIEIPSGNPIAGYVAWSAEGMIGVQFADAIDVTAMLNAPVSRAAGTIQRMPRVRIACPVTVAIEDSRSEATLIDISQGGVKLQTEWLRPGDEAVLTIRGIPPHRAVVRWAHDGQAGLSFLTRIPFDELAEWVLDRQAELPGARRA